MSLKRNTLWNLAGNGLPLLVGVVTIPYLVKQLGIEAFGILTLVWSLIGYFSLFDFGLGRALTQQIASRLHIGDQQPIAQLVKSGLLFTLGTGVVGGLLLLAAARPLATDWLHIGSTLQTQTRLCLLIAALGIPLTTLATGSRGVLEAYEDFKWVNLIRMGLGIATFGLPALTVMFIDTSLVWVVVSLVVTRLVVLIAFLMLVNQKLRYAWWRSRSSGTQIKNLLSFGAWMTVSNIIGPLMVTADRFIISATLGAGVVAYYTVPFEALIRILIIPTALSVTLFPRLAAHFAGERRLALDLYWRAIRIVALVLAPICLATALASHWGLRWWLGDTFADQSWMIVCILSVGIFFNGLAYIPLATIQANGQAKKTALLHCVELVLYVPSLFLALKWWGVAGAALVWTLRVTIDLVGLMWMARREFEPHAS